MHDTPRGRSDVRAKRVRTRATETPVYYAAIAAPKINPFSASLSRGRSAELVGKILPGIASGIPKASG
eukprot:279450-Pyramimonas_sp.AAC.1